MKSIIAVFIMTSLLPVSLGAQNSGAYDIYPHLALSGDGRVAAISGRSVADDSARNGFRYPIDFYDTETAIRISSFDDSEDDIEGLTLNSKGSLLAYSNNGGRLAVVDVQAGVEIGTVTEGGSTDTGYPLWSTSKDVFAAFFGPVITLSDGVLLSAVNTFYDEQSGDGISGFSWSADGRMIAYTARDRVTSNGMLVVLELNAESELALLKRFEAPASLLVALNSDGSTIATSTAVGVLLTNVRDAQQRLLAKQHRDDPLFSLAWSPDDERIAGGSSEAIFIWDIQSGDIVETIQVQDSVHDLYWSPDRQFLYHAGRPAGIYRNGIPLAVAVAETVYESLIAARSDA